VCSTSQLPAAAGCARIKNNTSNARHIPNRMRLRVASISEVLVETFISYPSWLNGIR
jgi:hypothetical protein